MAEQQIAYNQTVLQVCISVAKFTLQTISVFGLINTNIVSGDP